MDRITNRRTKPFFMTEKRLVDEGHIDRMGVPSAIIYICLRRYANTERQCSPSYSELEKVTGSARGTVSKALSGLIELGYIRKLPTERGETNIYEIMDLPLYSNVAPPKDTQQVHLSHRTNKITQYSL